MIKRKLPNYFSFILKIIRIFFFVLIVFLWDVLRTDGPIILQTVATTLHIFFFFPKTRTTWGLIICVYLPICAYIRQMIILKYFSLTKIFQKITTFNFNFTLFQIRLFFFHMRLIDWGYFIGLYLIYRRRWGVAINEAWMEKAGKPVFQSIIISNLKFKNITDINVRNMMNFEYDYKIHIIYLIFKIFARYIFFILYFIKNILYYIILHFFKHYSRFALIYRLYHYCKILYYMRFQKYNWQNTWIYKHYLGKELFIFFNQETLGYTYLIIACLLRFLYTKNFKYYNYHLMQSDAVHEKDETIEKYWQKILPSIQIINMPSILKSSFILDKNWTNFIKLFLFFNYIKLLLYMIINFKEEFIFIYKFFLWYINLDNTEKDTRLIYICQNFEFKWIISIYGIRYLIIRVISTFLLFFIFIKILLEYFYNIFKILGLFLNIIWYYYLLLLDYRVMFLFYITEQKGFKIYYNLLRCIKNLGYLSLYIFFYFCIISYKNRINNYNAFTYLLTFKQIKATYTFIDCLLNLGLYLLNFIYYKRKTLHLLLENFWIYFLILLIFFKNLYLELFNYIKLKNIILQNNIKYNIAFYYKKYYITYILKICLIYGVICIIIFLLYIQIKKIIIFLYYYIIVDFYINVILKIDYDLYINLKQKNKIFIFFILEKYKKYEDSLFFCLFNTLGILGYIIYILIYIIIHIFLFIFCQPRLWYLAFSIYVYFIVAGFDIRFIYEFYDSFNIFPKLEFYLNRISSYFDLIFKDYTYFYFQEHSNFSSYSTNWYKYEFEVNRINKWAVLYIFVRYMYISYIILQDVTHEDYKNLLQDIPIGPLTYLFSYKYELRPIFGLKAIHNNINPFILNTISIKLQSIFILIRPTPEYIKYKYLLNFITIKIYLWEYPKNFLYELRWTFYMDFIKLQYKYKILNKLPSFNNIYLYIMDLILNLKYFLYCGKSGYIIWFIRDLINQIKLEISINFRYLTFCFFDKEIIYDYLFIFDILIKIILSRMKEVVYHWCFFSFHYIYTKLYWELLLTIDWFNAYTRINYFDLYHWNYEKKWRGMSFIRKKIRIYIPLVVWLQYWYFFPWLKDFRFWFGLKFYPKYPGGFYYPPRFSVRTRPVEYIEAYDELEIMVPSHVLANILRFRVIERVQKFSEGMVSQNYNYQLYDMLDILKFLYSPKYGHEVKNIYISKEVFDGLKREISKYFIYFFSISFIIVRGFYLNFLENENLDTKNPEYLWPKFKEDLKDNLINDLEYIQNLNKYLLEKTEEDILSEKLTKVERLELIEKNIKLWKELKKLKKMKNSHIIQLNSLALLLYSKIEDYLYYHTLDVNSEYPLYNWNSFPNWNSKINQKLKVYIKKIYVMFIKKFKLKNGKNNILFFVNLEREQKLNIKQKLQEYLMRTNKINIALNFGVEQWLNKETFHYVTDDVYTEKLTKFMSLSYKKSKYMKFLSENAFCYESENNVARKIHYNYETSKKKYEFMWTILNLFNEIDLLIFKNQGPECMLHKDNSTLFLEYNLFEEKISIIEDDLPYSFELFFFCILFLPWLFMFADIVSTVRSPIGSIWKPLFWSLQVEMVTYLELALQNIRYLWDFIDIMGQASRHLGLSQYPNEIFTLQADLEAIQDNSYIHDIEYQRDKLVKYKELAYIKLYVYKYYTINFISFNYWEIIFKNIKNIIIFVIFFSYVIRVFIIYKYSSQSNNKLFSIKIKNKLDFQQISSTWWYLYFKRILWTNFLTKKYKQYFIKKK